MQKKIIGVASVRSVGGTFLDWSILFLNGNDSFFSNKTNKLEILSQNPLSAINAHGHMKNHPNGYEMSRHYIDTFLQSPYDMLTLYPITMFLETALAKLDIAVDQLQDVITNQIVQQYLLDDYAKFLEYLLDCNGDLIYIDHNMPLYDIEWRGVDRTIINPTPVATTDDVESDFQNVFFGKSLKTWHSMNLDNIWDTRERLALDKRPLAEISRPDIDFSRRHCFVDSMEWFTNGVDVIQRVMNFCNLKINPVRWNQWIEIHSQWQELHKKRLNFCYQLPHIVDAIVNNWYYEIDLTFNQEVVIQHCLIYQHNLNLKTWQLEKFPNNTQDLHKLLEVNIHPLRDV